MLRFDIPLTPPTDRTSEWTVIPASKPSHEANLQLLMKATVTRGPMCGPEIRTANHGDTGGTTLGTLRKASLKTGTSRKEPSTVRWSSSK